MGEQGRQWSTPPLAVRQAVLNWSGKARPGTAFEETKPVEVRVEWETDGWETGSGFAARWDPEGVFVVFDDPRQVFTGAWLATAHAPTVEP